MSFPKILVTGGAGLVGHEVIRQLLAQGKSVKAIYNKTPVAISSPLLTAVQCNILDVSCLEEVMAGIDEVYHCAGLVSFARGMEEQLYKINVEGTANIVNAALSEGVRKMVHVSSVSALGRLRDDELIDESMQWSEETSNSIYGRSKFLGEMEVWRGIAEGLNAVIVNPTIVLGAGDWENGSTGIFKSVYNEFPWYSEGTTGFVDVEDVAKAMIMLMKSEVTAERFIISAENWSYRKLFDCIANAFQKSHPSKKVTPAIAAMVWRWEALKSKFTGKAPLVTKETASTALAKVKYDNSKLNKFIPAFQYKPLEQTVILTCMSLQQKLNNH